MSSLEEKIKVMQAALAGRIIQYKKKTENEWTRESDKEDLGWNWIEYEYKVALCRFWIDPNNGYAYYSKMVGCIEVEEVLSQGEKDEQ